MRRIVRLGTAAALVAVSGVVAGLLLPPAAAESEPPTVHLDHVLYGACRRSLEAGRAATVRLGSASPLFLGPAVEVPLRILALDRVGPSFTFETQLLARDPERQGVLGGPLVLRLAGDPSLDRPTLDGLFRRAARRGVRRVEGDLVVDTTFNQMLPVSLRPELPPAKLLGELVADRGIELAGAVRFEPLAWESGTRLAGRESPPLGVLFRRGGRQARIAALAALATFLRDRGDMPLRDETDLVAGATALLRGGGWPLRLIDPGAAVATAVATCDDLVRLLAESYRDFDLGPELLWSLNQPWPGEGELRRARLYTASVEGARVVMGYAEAVGGRRVALAIILNQSMAAAAEQDRLLRRLYDRLLKTDEGP